MRDDTRAFEVTTAVAAVTPSAFVAEVDAFRATLADPSVPIAVKARAWDAIVRHATMLDAHEVGFERAGVALKEALCLWLDARTAPAHS
jgi:hypothetical protein